MSLALGSYVLSPDDPESCVQDMHLGQRKMTCQILSPLRPAKQV